MHQFCIQTSQSSSCCRSSLIGRTLIYKSLCPPHCLSLSLSPRYHLLHLASLFSTTTSASGAGEATAIRRVCFIRSRKKEMTMLLLGPGKEKRGRSAGRVSFFGQHARRRSGEVHGNEVLTKHVSCRGKKERKMDERGRKILSDRDRERERETADRKRPLRLRDTCLNVFCTAATVAADNDNETDIDRKRYGIGIGDGYHQSLLFLARISLSSPPSQCHSVFDFVPIFFSSLLMLAH